MNPSIDRLKASDGSDNASVATVSAARSGGATTIEVDTVAGWPDKFHATMGTPHTFVDPVTAETITVISEASAIDFTGHLDSGDIEIDEIAPGYTDGGSSIGDIVIVRPTTQWADAAAALLEVSHADDGALKVATGGAIEDENGNEQVKFVTTSSAVNEITVTNAATSGRPKISASGGDTNINTEITGKGTGGAVIKVPYKFSVYRNAALNSSNSYTKVDFDTTSFDTGSNVTTNDKFTAPVTGYYFLSGAAGNTSAGSTPQYAALYKNGSRLALGSGANATTSGFQSTVNGLFYLTAGDYIELYFVGGSGSTMNVGADTCYLTGFLVSI